jgi:uncharacterized paraquat-inducible protein A
VGSVRLHVLRTHVAAIIFPFVEMRALLSTSTYGLIQSVLMLLDYGMVVLAVLVVFFSIVFPFAKLAVLWGAWNSAEPGPLLGRLGRLAENLGRWSMLDIFLVLLLLAVTADQTLVATRPLVGMPCFLGGVLCSMTAGTLLAGRWPPPQAPVLVRSSRSWLFLGVAAVCMVGAQFMPVLRTESLLVTDRDFSLFDIAWAMLRTGNWGLAAAIGGGLLLLPWLTWGAYAYALVTGRTVALARHLACWSMLDVFGVALAIFVIESANAVPSLIAPGAIALFLGVAMRPIALRLSARSRELQPRSDR